MAAPVVEARGLTMRYGALEAVRGIDLEVAAGEVFAFLGPNGAGKTTTVEILEGYRRRSAGEVRVLGVDPDRPTRAWRERIGIVLQGSRPQPELTVAETVALYAAYYPHPRAVDDTIALVGLGESRDVRAGRLSGGQQRRLDVALAMVGDPELLFLDEPTTGFDPSARRSAWSLVTGLRELGTTVFLTTHYLEEAEALADRVAIIDGGRIVASGRPSSLGDRARPGSDIRFRLPADGHASLQGLRLSGSVTVSDEMVSVHSVALVADLHALTSWALERELELAELTVRRPTLEEAYLRLTAPPGAEEHHA